MAGTHQLPGETSPGDDAGALAAEILRFLGQHAKSAADFDPDPDEPSCRYNGPVPATLHAAAEALASGQDVPRVWSRWGSGCYRPLGDSAAEAWHNRLVAAVPNFRPAPRPVR
jgi:hypothetical protein